MSRVAQHAEPHAPMAIAQGPNAEVIGGVPLLAVIGTPRTMGQHLGARLKPRLQVLSQFLTEQLCTHATATGDILTQAELRESVEDSQGYMQRHEPALWMEMEAMAEASELPIADLLIIHGYQDLLSRFQCEIAPMESTYLCIDPTHTADGHALMALAWYLDPALFPYLTLLRRIPTHGPSTLCLTVAGLMPVAGLSEAGIAVARNELRVNDGVEGYFTSHLLSAMLAAPSFDDVQKRAHTGPRQGGGAMHGLSARGERFTIEVSGQQHSLLKDPIIHAPRVHTNHALDQQIASTVTTIDNTSKQRLEQTAAQVVSVSGVSPHMIEGWFGFSQSRQPSNPQGDSSRIMSSRVLITLDPKGKQIHLRRTGVPAQLETIKL